ncbi:hypothetical protein BJF78_00490 [Pseudonocardia sp. CNS-139]|nr:hypothetical protein BJF78_00490 [Pseudonocardia sp. CNS-139]
MLLDNARALGAGVLDLVRQVYVPAVLTWIIAGLRLSAAWSLLAAVVAEYLGSNRGIGYEIAAAQQQLDASGVDRRDPRRRRRGGDARPGPGPGRDPVHAVAGLLMAGRAAMAAVQVAVVVAALVSWQWLADTDAINTFVLGSPREIGDRLLDWAVDGALLADVGATLLVLVVGYAVGLCAGIVLGAVLGLSAVARQVLEPFVLFFNGMPRLLLYPLIVVVLGFGLLSKVTLVTLAVVVLVAVTIAAGFREIPQDLLDNMRLMGRAGSTSPARCTCRR